MSLSVNSVSSSVKYERTSCPKGALCASSSRPPWSSESLSSRAEHNMPWLWTPRNCPTLIRNGLPSSPGGKTAPTSAQGTLIPTRALGAPHTMLSKAPCPTSTSHTCSLSAFGCLVVDLISPTTMFENGGATGLSSSTSRPAIVRVSASCWVESGGLQNSRNQDSGNCISALNTKVSNAKARSRKGRNEAQ